MKNIGATLTDALLSVIYPPLCPCCGEVMTRGEGPMCLSCRLDFPFTDDIRNYSDNALTNKLQGIVPIQRAAAYFTYRRKGFQSAVIHEMKYRGRPDIGRRLAREFAGQLLKEGFFEGIDAIAPVPLNFWRHCRRGYNQSAYIAAGVADVTALPVVDALRAARHSSQTRLGADERRMALKNIYRVRPRGIHGVNHLLLVDDICTTGATLYACAEAVFYANPGIRVSALVLASTSLL